MGRLNSGNSSRNRTPLCARLTSPGDGIAEPPRRPASEMVWWGDRKGRVEMTDADFPRRSPHVLWMRVVSMASSSDMGGMRPGMRFASMDLPQPGDPMRRRLCPPLTATSMARRARCWPRISDRSGTTAEAASARSSLGLDRKTGMG
ncbi:MAG: hypothetical protein RIS92_839 [Verrucomicrobiota bacterium]